VEGKFSADWTLEGQLHAAIIRSDVASGTLNSIDLDSVREAPGVKLVLTAEDVTDAGFGNIPSGPPLKNADGEEASLNAMPLLAGTTVKFVGQPWKKMPHPFTKAKPQICLCISTMATARLLMQRSMQQRLPPS